MCKIALATVSVLVLLCACSKTKTISTRDATVSVTEQGKDESSVHVTGKDGASLDINSGKPITGYPSDTPLYSGKSMMDLKSGEKNSRVVALQTSDSLEKINDFYKSGLESNGWKIDTSMTTPQMTMYVASKGSRKLVIQLSTDSSSKLQNISQTLSDK